jgi:hypothetical protein
MLQKKPLLVKSRNRQPVKYTTRRNLQEQKSVPGDLPNDIGAGDS